VNFDVNETYDAETETIPRRSTPGDRLETETFETETTTLAIPVVVC